MAIAKAWAAATGGHRAGVLESSFVAEVKSDLMGEQTILCGMLQACLFLESRPIGTFRERNPFSAEGSCGNLIVPSRHCSNGAT